MHRRRRSSTNGPAPRSYHQRHIPPTPGMGRPNSALARPYGFYFDRLRPYRGPNPSIGPLNVLSQKGQWHGPVAHSTHLPPLDRNALPAGKRKSPRVHIYKIPSFLSYNNHVLYNRFYIHTQNTPTPPYQSTLLAPQRGEEAAQLPQRRRRRRTAPRLLLALALPLPQRLVLRGRRPRALALAGLGVQQPPRRRRSCYCWGRWPRGRRRAPSWHGMREAAPTA